MSRGGGEPAALVVCVTPGPGQRDIDPSGWLPDLRRLSTAWLTGSADAVSGWASVDAGRPQPGAADVLLVVGATPAAVWAETSRLLPGMPPHPDGRLVRRDPGTGPRDVARLPLSDGTRADALRERLARAARGGAPAQSPAVDSVEATDGTEPSWATVVDSQWGLDGVPGTVLHATFGPAAGVPMAIRRDTHHQWVIDYATRYFTAEQALQWVEPLMTGNECRPSARGMAEQVREALQSEEGRILIADDDARLTPAEVDRATASLAARLRAEGVRPGDPVLVHVRRGAGAVIACIALLRAGAVYVPVDAALPPRRANLIRRLSGARLIVGEPIGDAEPVDAGAPAGGGPRDTPVIPLDPEEWDARDGRAETAAPTRPGDGGWHRWGPDECPYLLFTSGSTGAPKGVAMSYRCIDALVARHRERPRRLPRPRVAQFASTGFDVSYQEIMCTLAEGGEIRVVPEPVRRDAAALCAWITANRVDTLYSPAVMLRELAAAATAEGSSPFTLRRLIHAGEPLLANDDLTAMLRALPGIVVHNQYGPTETHVVTENVLDAARIEPGPVGLGRALGEGWVTVLDERLRPVAPGEMGELHVRSPHHALGYWGDAVRTALAFIPDPAVPGGRLYRTGDLVRADADGAITFVGRADDQVKIRGHRVEPGEVSAAIDGIPGVRQVVMVACGGAPGEDAWLRARVEAAPTVTEESIRAHLVDRLPGYAVPREIVVAGSLPRTDSGKLSRTADVGHRIPGRRPGAGAPGAVDESPVRAAWAEALDCDPRDPRDFVSLGGDSLAAMRLARRLRLITGREVGVADVLGGTADELARLLDGERGGAGGCSGCGDTAESFPILPAQGDPHAPFALLDQQQAYLIGRDGDLGGGEVSCHLYLEYAGRRSDVDVPRLIRALHQVLARHPMCAAAIDPGTGMQRLTPGAPHLEVPIVDAGDAAAEAARIRRRMAVSVRDPLRPPLLEVVVVRDDSEVRTCVDVDALIADARSIHLLLGEWDEAYSTGRIAGLPPRTTFRDYVESHRRWLDGAGEEARAADRAYWSTAVAELPPAPQLPRESGAGDAGMFRHRRHDLPADMWARVARHARERGLTPSTVLLAAYSCALANWSAHRRFTLNVPRFGRAGEAPDLDAIVGEFASFTLLDADLRDDASFHAIARRLQRRLHRDLSHTSVSGMEVVRELFRQRGTSDEPVAPVVFTSELGIGGDLSSLAGGAMSQEWAISQTPQVALDLQVADHGESVALRFDVLDAAIPDDVVDGIWGNLLDQVHRLADAAAWLSPPAPAARARALRDRGDAGPPERCAEPLTAWIDRRADGDDPWCIAGDGAVTYRQLAGRVSAGIRGLAGRGVADGAPVAVAVADRCEAVIASLTVSHGGWCVVPLDPSSPPARIRELVDLAGATLLITDRGDCADAAPVVVTPREIARAGGAPAAATPATRSAGECAAILFTGGSTGRPKGVRVPREGLEACVAATVAMCGLRAGDRSLLLAQPHHDMSILDVYVMGAVGGAVIAPADPDGAEWATLAERHGATVVCAVPAAVDLLTEGARATGAALADLRIVLTGGDWVPPELVRRVRDHAPDARIWSIGGPTETTGWNIAHRITGDITPPGWTSVPYGRPLPGAHYRIVDERGHDRPAGVEGELTVTGPGVMLGYLGQPGGSGFSADSADSANSVDSMERAWEWASRTYATGDRGAWRPPGLVEFRGRADRQVEIRGHRVEPAETEARMREIPGVSAAAVVPLPGGSGVRGLGAAYAGPAREHDVLDALREVLPPYSVPGHLLRVDAVPVTPSGKTDRRMVHRLLVERAAATHATASSAPAGPGSAHAGPGADPLALLIADIWAESSRVDAMDPQVPFLRAGGDSLGALRAVTAMREIFDPGIPVTIRTLLHGATAADCAAALRATPDGPEFESLASDYMGAGADATGPDPNPGTAPNTGMDPDTETDTDTTKEAQFA